MSNICTSFIRTFLIVFVGAAVLCLTVVMRAPLSQKERRRVQVARRIKALLKGLKLICFIMSLPFFVGVAAYRSNWRISQELYACMLRDVRFRNFYGSVFFFLGCAIHFVWLTAHGGILCCLASTLLICVFLSHRLMHRTMTLLHNRRVLFIVFMCVLAVLPWEGMYMTAAAGYMLIVASVFYPTRRALYRYQHPDGLRRYTEHPDEIRYIYFKE